MSKIVKHVMWKHFLLFFTVGLVLLGRGHQRTDDQLLDTVRRDALSAWKQARNAQQSLLSRGQYEVHHRTLHWNKGLEGRSPHSITHTIQVLDVDHRKYLRSYSSDPNSETENLIVVNPTYNFGLVRNSSLAPWTVDETHQLDDKLSDGLYGKVVSTKHIGGMVGVSGVAFGFKDIMLEDQSNLDFKSANRVNYANKEAVKCEFLLPVPVIKVDPTTGIAKEVQQPAKCDTILDPNMNWSVLEFSMAIDSSNKIVAKYSYDHTDTGVIYRSKSRVENYVDGVLTEWVTSESSFAELKLTKSDFTLLSYGFPEPDHYIPSRPWWVYTSITGVGIVIIGVIVLRIGRNMHRR